MSARILVVEDEWIIATNLKVTLEELGFVVTNIASSGEDALSKAEKDQPDIVLMDIILGPGLDGIEVAEKIYDTQDIPVIYMTSHVNDDIIKRAKVTKPFGYIVKPYEKASLHSTIEMALYNHQIDKELKEKTRQMEELNRNLENRVQEEIQKSRDREYMLVHQSKLASMGEMMGAIAHQWRQPLNVIALLIQDLEEAYRFNEIDSSYVESMVRETMENLNAMSNTITDFRNFFKPKHEKIHFDLKDSIEEVLSLLYEQFENYNIHISLIPYEDDSHKQESIIIYGYLDEFQQVILNLLNNGKDSILAKRKIKPVKEKGLIEISIILRGDKAVIKIKDNGTGISEHIKDRIFEPYFSTRPEGYGTGLGLYMSKVIIENHMGGKMYVDNGNTIRKPKEALHEKASFAAIFTVELTRHWCIDKNLPTT